MNTNEATFGSEFARHLKEKSSGKLKQSKDSPTLFELGWLGTALIFSLLASLRVAEKK